jgi:hypothetical protein
MTSPVLRSHPTVGAARRCGVAMLALCLGVGAADTALAGQRQQQIPRTSAEANGDSLGSAMAAPLRDINVVRSDIPDLLTKAQTDPYAPPTPGCAPLKAEIAQFDAVLGDDYDNRKDAKDEGAMSRPVLGVVASTITDVIPMRGWVRRLTGAERHDQMVRDAIKAGMVRRGYLKGLYNASACQGNRLVFVDAKAAPKPVYVAAEPAAPPAPVQVVAEAAPIPVKAPLAPFSTVMSIAVAPEAAVSGVP